MSRFERTDRGSASIWVLAACALVLLAAGVVQVRASAVFARHRVEAAADLAALAAAQRIGTSSSGAEPCRAADQVARANAAHLVRCVTVLVASGRSGRVDVRVVASVRLPVVGSREVGASARAERASPRPHSTGARSMWPSTRSSSQTAPALSSGSFPLPHFGDCTHDGHPVRHSHELIASRVAVSQSVKAACPRSAKPAPP